MSSFLKGYEAALGKFPLELHYPTLQSVATCSYSTLALWPVQVKM